MHCHDNHEEEYNDDDAGDDYDDAEEDDQGIGNNDDGAGGYPLIFTNFTACNAGDKYHVWPPSHSQDGSFEPKESCKR